MANLVRRQILFSIAGKDSLSFYNGWQRCFSVQPSTLKSSSNESKYLRTARTAEKSIRVLSKESMRMPSDVGLLDKTFIMPIGFKRPSIFKSPSSLLTLLKTQFLSRARDYFSILLSKFTSPKVTGFWNRSFNIDRSSLVPIATALHHQMYTAFAEGDDQTLHKICLDGIHDNFRVRIAIRPRDEKVVWKLVKYTSNPRLVSNRAAKTPVEGMVIRQAVVQICSIQKLTRYRKTPSGQLEQVQGSGKEKEIVENLVIQRIYDHWLPQDWMIWGTAKETSLEDIQEWNKV